jgi:hypothetical protein
MSRAVRSEVNTVRVEQAAEQGAVSMASARRAISPSDVRQAKQRLR